MMATGTETAGSDLFRQVLKTSRANETTMMRPSGMSIVPRLAQLGDTIRKGIGIGRVGKNALHIVTSFIKKHFLLVNVGDVIHEQANIL